MATFKATFTQGANFKATLTDSQNLKAGFGEVQTISTGDYEKLSNKPSIEGNTLIGDKTFVELGLNEITPQEIDDIIFGGN